MMPGLTLPPSLLLCVDQVIEEATVESETIDMIRRSIVWLVLATMVAVAACASRSVHPHREIFDDVPAKIDPGARYLFHMHGWVVELMGPAGAVSTGYWWRWTVEAFADRGFVVISEARSHGTNVQAYALTVARQVARLRAAGVPSDHITVTGMSKGGGHHGPDDGRDSRSQRTVRRVRGLSALLGLRHSGRVSGDRSGAGSCSVDVRPVRQ